MWSVSHKRPSVLDLAALSIFILSVGVCRDRVQCEKWILGSYVDYAVGVLIVSQQRDKNGSPDLSNQNVGFRGL